MHGDNPCPAPRFSLSSQTTSKITNMITEKDAIALINLAESLEINVFIDGGWGVDALLGEQTREHQDIDLFVEERQAARFISMPCTNKDSRSEPKPTPRLIISFLQMRIGGQWTCICLIMTQMAALSLKEKLIRRIRSAGRVISARRKCPASLCKHKSLSIQDMLLMTMISEMCLPYAAVFISPFQMNICLMQINPKSPK